MTDIQWNRMRDGKWTQRAPEDRVVRVMYADGLECNAKRVSGNIFIPEGDNVYRYVDVIAWREI